MTSQPVPGSRPPATIDRTEKKTLLVRIGIAGVLILAMIGALALFEQQQKQPAPDAPESRKSPGTAPSPPTPALQNQAGGPIAEPPAAAPAKPEPPAEPERSGPPQVAEPGAGGKASGVKPPVDKALPAAAEDTHPRLIVGRGSEPPPLAKSPAPQSPPPARPATLESPPLARPAGGSGFLVQVGVFSNLGNAEELRKKLADAGIPAQIEARVHVGPFATQAEAAAAQQKLKSIGMEPGMVLPARR